MRVKRYVVNSMPDALEKIRVELGKDAVILNTKPIKKGGLFGWFGKQQIEVIAAVESRPQERMTERQAERPLQPVQQTAVKQAYQQAAQRPAAPEPASQSVLALAAAPLAAAGVGTRPAAVSGYDPPRPTAAADGAVVVPPADPPMRDIAHELRDMREMFQKLLLTGDDREHVPEPFVQLRRRLLGQEVEEQLVAHILGRVLKSFPDPTQAGAADVRQAAAQVIAGMLRRHPAIPPRIPRSVRYAFLFGPTGVGKTTTIAKLAAECVLKEKRKVGFITSDTYRIAAVEQLRTYANILNVPLEVVFSPREIEPAMERLAGMDLVLIDTAGRNYRNDEFANGMKEYLRFGDTFENYLVLSLTSRYSDIKPVVEKFSDVPIAKVIFTKSDETDAYGSILNVIHHYGLNLSYITTGQNVPDDLMVATPEMVAEWILGDGGHA